MKTYMLFWNPAAGGYTLMDFGRDLRQMEFGEIPWPVPTSMGAASGDNFYMVGNGGVVMKGFFLSDPYRGDYGHGRSAENWYLDLRPTFMIRPDHPRGLLSVEELGRAMPSFGWSGVGAASLLPEELRPTMDSLWDGYMSRFGLEDFDGETADVCGRPEGGLDEALSLAVEANYGLTDADGSPSILGVLRTAMEQTDEDGVVAALLRSVLTLPDWDAGYIRGKGFSERVVNAARLGI